MYNQRSLLRGTTSHTAETLMHRTASGVLISLMAFFAAESGEVAAGQTTAPLQRAIDTPRGQLKNPYSDSDSAAADEGYKIYLSLDCNGCHGGGGGGGMAAPLTNPVWIYGDEDDTLFRIIVLGTGSLSPGDAFRKHGYKRIGSEHVVGPMPPFGHIIETEDDVWKIIVWIRTKNPRRGP